MKSYGIICEWNPLHNGHAAMMAQARADGAECIVCIMSGNGVQRGETALSDRHLRARMALASGADLVLELPYPWSCAGAEFFARAGVFVASAFCDTLWFGSECGDAEVLREAAEASVGEDFRAEYEACLAEGMGCAEAHRAVLLRRTGRELGANDTLGVAYLQAIRSLGVGLTPRTVPRMGDAYHLESPASPIASATALRRLLREQGIDALSPYVPQSTVALLRQAEWEGRLTDPELLDRALLAFFRLHEPQDFGGIAEADGGIAERICHAAHTCATAQEMFRAVRTKRYTDARLRRAMLYCMTGVTAEDLRTLPAYTRLLAANALGCQLLAQKRKDGTLPVLAKSADVPDTPSAARQAQLEKRMDAVFTQATVKPTATAASLLRAPWIEKN